MEFEKAAEMDSLAMESRLRKHYQRELVNKDFYRVCRWTAQSNGAKSFLREKLEYLRSNRFFYSDPLANFVEKSAAVGLSDAWLTEGGRALAAAGLLPVKARDALLIAARFSLTAPLHLNNILMAGGFSVDTTGEGFPKAVRHPELSNLDLDPTKITGLAVFTAEVVEATDGASVALFERGMANATTEGVGQEFAEQWAAYGTVAASAGADFRATLASMLNMAEPSVGYLCFAPAGTVQGLAVDPFATAMTPQGGEFAPGVWVLPWEPGSNDSDLLLCPLSRAAMKDYGMVVRSARHASVDMADTPSSPSEQVSLWQTNCVGLLVERQFALSPAAPAVTAELPA